VIEMPRHYIEDDWRKPIQKMEVGDKVTTKSRVITRTEIELLALLGGDYAPQFLSEDAARENGWDRQLVPGVHCVNVAYGLLIQMGFLKDVIAYMGTSNMKFLRPVYWGDSIRVEAEVNSKNKTDKGWICEYDWIIRNQDGVSVAKGHNI
jgi:oxepin-CoA hydrolase / 3-oxo-5,6-dehydrosuberyl-CoA semialdehyde dehydrogenase